jgi:hypothetical protein
LFGRLGPQFRGEGIPDDLAGVVVAVGIEGLADGGVTGVVAASAAQSSASHRDGPGMAAQGAAVRGEGAVVDGSEAWSGEGDEDLGVLADRFGDGLAADEPGPVEVEDVVAVEGGAGRAAGAAPVAAGEGDPSARFGLGAVAVEDLAGGGGDDLAVAVLPDGGDAALGSFDLGQPLGEAGLAGLHQGVLRRGRQSHLGPVAAHPEVDPVGRLGGRDHHAAPTVSVTVLAAGDRP